METSREFKSWMSTGETNHIHVRQFQFILFFLRIESFRRLLPFLSTKYNTMETDVKIFLGEWLCVQKCTFIMYDNIMGTNPISGLRFTAMDFQFIYLKD